MPKTLNIQGIELTGREAGTIGQLRALSRLETEFGVALLNGGVNPDAFQDLIVKPGGVHALLACLFTGPVEAVDEDALPLSTVTEVLLDFFGSSGQPSTGLPTGSPPSPPSESGSESPATS